ncbi:hypothetical protein L218DRAFT_944081 [Marasmius fiardii PR-910]|nr:hypothetical protein L218DRAFT_944081 [Marasmius fiardii PR-910]
MTPALYIKARESRQPSPQPAHARYKGISLCTLVISVAGILSMHPLSKPITDRSTLHLTSFLFFSIGLNLQLVMIHKVDGTRMEKYYIGGSLFLASLLGIMTHLFGQLTFLTQAPYRKPLGPKQYRNVVLRIALYPFASLTTLGIVTFGTVCIMVARGITDQSDWKVLLALRLVCLARGTIYGIAAASDPVSHANCRLSPKAWKCFIDITYHENLARTLLETAFFLPQPQMTPPVMNCRSQGVPGTGQLQSQAYLSQSYPDPGTASLYLQYRTQP